MTTDHLKLADEAAACKLPEEWDGTTCNVTCHRTAMKILPRLEQAVRDLVKQLHDEDQAAAEESMRLTVERDEARAEVAAWRKLCPPGSNIQSQPKASGIGVNVNPLHPGVVLHSVYMAGMYLPLPALAEKMGLSPVEVQAFINGETSVTPEFAAKLAHRSRYEL